MCLVILDSFTCLANVSLPRYASLDNSLAKVNNTDSVARTSKVCRKMESPIGLKWWRKRSHHLSSQSACPRRLIYNQNEGLPREDGINLLKSFGDKLLGVANIRALRGLALKHLRR